MHGDTDTRNGTTGNGNQGTAGMPPNGGGQAVPDFGPLAVGGLSGGDTLDDGGGEDYNGLVGNQDEATGDTETGSMGADTAALGGAAAVSGPDAGGPGIAQGEGGR